MPEQQPTGGVALVTGGARMGEALGRALTARGHAVAFSANRSGGALRQVAAALIDEGHAARVYHADLRDPGACASLVERVLAWHGRLDVLVCLASTFERVPLDAVTPDIWRAHLAIDLDASFHCARAAAASMRRAGQGLIVFSADWVAASARPRYTGYVPYYVAKAALVALTETMALELADTGVRVNAIAPGPILPAAGTTPAQQAAVMDATPLRRWGTPAALVEAVCGLLDGTFVTGETVRVDGGRHLL